MYNSRLQTSHSSHSSSERFVYCSWVSNANIGSSLTLLKLDKFDLLPAGIFHIFHPRQRNARGYQLDQLPEPFQLSLPERQAIIFTALMLITTTSS